MLHNLLIHKGEYPDALLQESLPQRFTNPFSYIPDALCREAALSVQQYLQGQPRWHEELQRGKMFGVLVVLTKDGELGYLAAFSGNLQGQNNWDFFVPPVCDLLHPDEFYKVGEREISTLNAEIASLEGSSELVLLKERIAEVCKVYDVEIAMLKEVYRAGKAAREEKRKRLMEGGLDVSGGPRVDAGLDVSCGDADFGGPNVCRVSAEELLAEITRESQFQKAEIKRAERRYKEALSPLEEKLAVFCDRIDSLKLLRKEKSAALQEEIFENFTFLNGRGEEKSLLKIFREYYNDAAVLPPGGAGECAAPKLLQYAFMHGMRPVSMGEFWWGDSPKGEIRRHGEFYPSCKGKCAPILGFMLQGLEVAAPVHSAGTACNLRVSAVVGVSGTSCCSDTAGVSEDSVVVEASDNIMSQVAAVYPVPIDVLYEDDWILAVDKPSGILSVPGKDSRELDVPGLLRMQGYSGPLFSVHRLDMHTSGVLVLAKDEAVYKELQRQFAGREVEKCYLAVLEGEVAGAAGRISLPLAPDYDCRPCQKVDFSVGKEAVTRFEILRVEECCAPASVSARTFVRFYPLTGRTHQLRIHSAHHMGLNAPIVGDLLYGSPADRLMLHALSVSFVHPITSDTLEIVSPAPENFI